MASDFISPDTETKASLMPSDHNADLAIQYVVARAPVEDIGLILAMLGLDGGASDLTEDERRAAGYTRRSRGGWERRGDAA